MKLQAVKDAATDQNFRRIESQFPIGSANLQAVIVPKVSSLPGSGQEAEIVYSEADNKLYFHNGTEWKAVI